MRTLARLAVLVAVPGLLAAGCGKADPGPGVAALDGASATPSARASAPTGKADPVAYAKCMRAKGVPGFPDPNSDGKFSLNANSLGVPPDSPQFKAAETACEHLMPLPSKEQQAERHAKVLVYVACMRGKGIPLPDPPPPGDGAQTNTNSGQDQQDPGFDPESPQFQAAHEACGKHLPPGDGPSLSRSER